MSTQPEQPPSNVVQGIAPPHSIEAEQSVLGAMLLSEKVHYTYVLDVGLRPDDFYRDRHRLIFEAMLDLYNESEPIDVVTVAEHLAARGKLDAAGGRGEIDSLAAAVPAVGALRRYAEIVREHSLLRRLLTTTYEIQTSVHDHTAPPRELIERAEKSMLEVARDDRQKDFRKVGEVLGEEVVKWEELSKQGISLTGTPSGFALLDDITGGFQPGNLIILAARPAMGKCVRGSTVVVDNYTGTRRRIDDVVADLEEGGEFFATSLGPDLKLRTTRVTRGFRQGRQPVFRLRTKLGRELVATANHPLLTIGGWKRLDELHAGSRIAVPRRLPGPTVDQHLPDEEIVLLAAMIADGCAASRSTPTFYFANTECATFEEVERAAGALGARVHVTPRGTGATVSGRDRGAGNPVRQLLERYGLWGKLGDAKSVPEVVFALPDHQVARFLAVLYGCDGHIHATGRLRQIGYTTISEQLAKDVQHLLLRFGIVSEIRTLKRNVYEGTGKVAREVLITGQEDLRLFARHIAVVGKLAPTIRLVDGLLETPVSTNCDTAPPGVWDQVLAAKGARSWGDVSEAAGYRRNHNWHVGAREPSRPRLAQLAEVLDSPELDRLATSDIWWDEVVSIEPAGEEETFDLEVPGDHNFVADDIVVHNSALVTNIAENVALHHQRPKPVALFSLEMSEAELAQRFIASQASIKGDDLRKGRLSDERKWRRVLEHANRFHEAPLYVDDSSDVGLLEIRAKARRLHQQTYNEYGGLGLVVIDYLQLMRADTRIESRVLQVGEMSRGLKILAKELNVPVIALSQLSRGVESRTEKKPMLSDLRESGCLTGDTLVHLPLTGERVKIADLEGREPFTVLALNPETWALEPRAATRAFCTGTKPVYELTTRLGRTIRATANHRFLTFDGWQRLDELSPQTHLALPRCLPEPAGDAPPTADALALLGHLIGDGSTLPRHAIQYTTRERELAEVVAALATSVFGAAVSPRIHPERSWIQVYLSATDRLARGRRNPIATWLSELGVFGLRSHEKRVPEAVRRSPNERIAIFLRHLWATDGCVWHSPGKAAHRIYYATSSPQLADDVAHLLLRLGIKARVSAHRQPGRGRDQHHVDVSGKDDVLRFLAVVGTLGTRRGQAAERIQALLAERTASTNRDVIPRAAWRRHVVPAMARAGVTTRELQSGLGMSYCGSTLYRTNLSRERATRVADLVSSPELANLAAGDVYWDQIVSIRPAGEERVYDLTVEGLHNFVAGDIVVHNSIEQDADVVIFIYRDEYYNGDQSERPGEADLIIAKNRQGQAGVEVPLSFQGEYPRFMTLQRAE